jgi:F-box interacting protein
MYVVAQVDKRCDKSTEGDMLFGNHDFIKVTEGDDVNVAVKETSHSQNSTLTMRKTTQTSTLSISRKPSFKPIYRKPSNKDCMLIKWRQTITPQIIVPYDYYDYNQDEEFIALTIIHFPENPRNTISNPMEDGFPIGALGGECLNSVIRGLVFVVGRTYYRVGNPTIRSISPVTQHPTMLDSDLFLVKYSMGYDDILNLYKIVRFLSLNNRAGTVIHAFTIGVDDDWRVVGFSNLLIIFDQWIPNEGIQTLGSGPHYLVHQSSQVHFSCENQLVLSFDFLTEQVRNRLIPANIQGIPTLCVLQNTLCLSELHDNILRIHRSIGIDWMLWFQVDILFRIPELTRYMQLPICLHENLLLLAFYGQFPLPGDPLYRYQHGVVVNVATGAVDLVDGFSQMDWFLAKTFVGSSEVLPY